MDWSLEEVQRMVLRLVQEGSVCVSTTITDGKRTFIHANYATPQERALTKVWLKNPHFEIH